jgi:predicted membrane GTPase involved in stress response
MVSLKNIPPKNTRGTVVIYSLMLGYEPIGTPLLRIRNCVLTAFETGTATPYSLQNVKQREKSFIGTGTIVRWSNH